MQGRLRVTEILERLRAASDPRALEGMARFGINTEHAYGGISTAVLRRTAREIGKDHALARDLWATGIHEARILSAYIDEPSQVTEVQMEHWVAQFDSWDICDQVCGNLFDRTPLAYAKASEWSRRPEEFVKRAGFALMAWLAVHDKSAPDESFLDFFPLIVEGSSDDRNYVKKAVNWALRQIGKRNRSLNRAAVRAARDIQATGSRSGRWIASDALRELTGESVRRRLGR